MRFIDEATIRVVSGNGGDGVVAFRREKYVAQGGPSGGDGGRGGDVVLVANNGCNTLIDLRAQPMWRAEDGERGGGADRYGAAGVTLELPCPVGTRVFDDETGALVYDLVSHGQRAVVAKGGDGGLGNIHFKSSTNRTPRKALPGWPGQDRQLRLELVLMADVGLLGFPNAGKSTLISAISAARPKVADYPFTTLVPNLGVVKVGTEGSFVVADMPGLIRGAADGAGLGHRFLRHVARNRVLLHLVSLAPDEEEGPVERYLAIRGELEAYDPALVHRPELVVLTKADTRPIEEIREVGRSLAEASGQKLRLISAVTGQGVQDLVRSLWRELLAQLAREESEGAAEPAPRGDSPGERVREDEREAGEE
jgi:GTP-binding protein